MERIAVIGAGEIGLTFAVLFAAHGRPVSLIEIDDDARARAAARLSVRCEAAIATAGLGVDAAEVAGRITLGSSLNDAAGAALVQECVSESLTVKHAVVAELTPVLTGSRAVVASSSSAFMPSEIFAGSPLAGRGIVGHPINPPSAIPLVELVPSDATEPDALDLACAVYEAAGLYPVRLKREIAGFVTNRLQAALLREAYLLVADGIADPADVDAAVRMGIGRRWAFYGPFEVADLNTRGGIAAHSERLGGRYGSFAEERTGRNPWREPEVLRQVAESRRAELPLEEWDSATLQRDARLARLARMVRGDHD